MIPIAHPYITASVYLVNNPLQKNYGKKVIKSKCNSVFCSSDKMKYDHDFYLYYDENSNRWVNILPNITGNMKVYISGLYMGYYGDGNTFYHAIQLTEFDFEPKSNKTTYSNYDDDDDELNFGIPKSKKSSSNDKRKYDLSSESSEVSSSSSSTTQNKKKKKKQAKKTKTSYKTPSTTEFNETTEVNESVKFKQQLSYDNLPLNLADNNKSATHPHPPYPYYNPSLPPPLPPSQSHNINNQYHPYYPYPNYNPSLYSQTSYDKDNKSSQLNLLPQTTFNEPQNDNSNKDKKSVQFILLDDDSQPNDAVEEETKPTNTKQGSKGSGKPKSSKTPTRKSPRKKGGVMNIAVEKIIEIPSAEYDDTQINKTQSKKVDSFMDTESDYHTQNEEMPDISDNSSE